MHVGQSISFAFVLALATAASVFGQGTAGVGGAVPEPRGYIAAFGGAVAAPPTWPVFSIEYAEDLHRQAQAYATLSYFDNLMSETLRDALDTAATNLSALTGDPWSLSGRDRGVAFVVGGKYLFGNGGVRPYVGGGAGIIHVKRLVTESHVGDVTAAVYNDYNLGDGDLSLSTSGLRRPLAEAAVGVGLGTGSTYVDIGYRFRTAFGLDSGLDFSQITVGIGYRF